MAASVSLSSDGDDTPVGGDGALTTLPIEQDRMGTRMDDGVTPDESFENVSAPSFLPTHRPPASSPKVTAIQKSRARRHHCSPRRIRPSRPSVRFLSLEAPWAVSPRRALHLPSCLRHELIGPHTHTLHKQLFPLSGACDARPLHRSSHPPLLPSPPRTHTYLHRARALPRRVPPSQTVLSSSHRAR